MPNLTLFSLSPPGELLLNLLYQLTDSVSEFCVSNSYSNRPALHCPGVISTGRHLGATIPSEFELVQDITSQTNSCVVSVGQPMGSVYSNISTFTLPSDVYDCIQTNLAEATANLCSGTASILWCIGIAFCVIIAIATFYVLNNRKSSQHDVENVSNDERAINYGSFRP